MEIDKLVEAIVILKKKGISAPEAVMYLQAFAQLAPGEGALGDVGGSLVDVEQGWDEEMGKIGFR